jgi:hypothetical protein
MINERDRKKSQKEGKDNSRAEAILDDRSPRSDSTTRNYSDLRRNKRFTFEMITGAQTSTTYKTTRYINDLTRWIYD